MEAASHPLHYRKNAKTNFQDSHTKLKRPGGLRGKFGLQAQMGVGASESQ